MTSSPPPVASRSGPGGNGPPRKGGLSFAGTLALLVLALGGLNWGLVGLADVDVVAALLGRGTWATRAVQSAFALAALYCLFRLPRWSRAS